MRLKVLFTHFLLKPDKKDTFVSAYLSEYKKKYNKEPGITCDVGYDAANMIAEAIKLSSGSTGVDIQKGLMMIKNYHGASGIMEFDSNGDVHKAMVLKTVNNGVFECN